MDLLEHTALDERRLFTLAASENWNKNTSLASEQMRKDIALIGRTVLRPPSCAVLLYRNILLGHQSTFVLEGVDQLSSVFRALYPLDVAADLGHKNHRPELF
jgi:hypothetical protein